MTIADFVTVEWAPASDPTSTTPTWVDITGIVMEVDIQGGRSGVFDLYGPRTATIRCRNGTKSPAVAPTFDIQGFYRWRQIRVTEAVFENGLFTGYIQSVVHDQTNSPYHGEVTIICTDAVGVLASGEFNPTDTFGSTVNGLLYASQMTAAVEGAVALAGLDVSLVAVQTPSTAWFKLPDEPSGQILSWLQSVMEAEASGGIQSDGNGVLRVNGRWTPFLHAGSTPSLTFSDTPGVGDARYLKENLTFASTDTDYYNRGVAKSEYWDATFTEANVPAGYPTETLSRTDLPFVYQSWAEANAAMYVDLYSQTVTYPRSLSVFIASPGTSNDQFSNLLALVNAMGSSWVVVEHTPVGDTQQTYNVTVEAFAFHITPGLWTCEYEFASLDRWFAAYSDGAGGIAPLVVIGGDASNGIGSDAIIAP